MSEVKQNKSPSPDVVPSHSLLCKGYADSAANITTILGKVAPALSLYTAALTQHPISSSIAAIDPAVPQHLSQIEKLPISSQLLIAKFLALETSMSEVNSDSLEDKFCAWVRAKDTIQNVWNGKLSQFFTTLDIKGCLVCDQLKAEDPDSFKKNKLTEIKACNLPKSIENPIIEMLQALQNTKLRLSEQSAQLQQIEKSYKESSGLWKWVFSPLQSFKKYKSYCNESEPYENEISNLNNSLELQNTNLHNIGSEIGFLRHFRFGVSVADNAKTRSFDVFAQLIEVFETLSASGLNHNVLDIKNLQKKLLWIRDLRELDKSIEALDSFDGWSHKTESKQIEAKARFLIGKGGPGRGCIDIAQAAVNELVDTLGNLHRRRIDCAYAPLYADRLDALDLKFAEKFGYSALGLPSDLLNFLLCAAEHAANPVTESQPKS